MKYKRIPKLAERLIRQLNDYGSGWDVHERWTLSLDDTGLNPKALGTIDDIQFYVVNIALAEDTPNKQKYISQFVKRVSEGISGYPIMLQESPDIVDIDIVPAESSVLGSKPQSKSKIKSAQLWYMALQLVREIKRSPDRLKVCPYCRVIFWDYFTKAGSRVVCGKKDCQKQYNAQRSRESYHNRRGK